MYYISDRHQVDERAGKIDGELARLRGDYVLRTEDTTHGRFWRFYRTASGACPVRAYLDGLTLADRAAVQARMERVRERGFVAARHLRGDIYEVRVSHDRRQFRVLFAAEGRYGQVLLAVEAFKKETQKTPPERIDLAEQRLRDHRARANVTGSDMPR